jgi:hypothetical protein
MRQLRIALGIVILVLSIILLAWGFFPRRHEVRTQPISPTELQLPTPEAFHFNFAVVMCTCFRV